jgi:hypothetical protein
MTQVCYPSNSNHQPKLKGSSIAISESSIVYWVVAKATREIKLSYFASCDNSYHTQLFLTKQEILQAFRFCTILYRGCEKLENITNIIFYTTKWYQILLFFCVIGVFHRLATADSFQGRPIFLPIHLSHGLFILSF